MAIACPTARSTKQNALKGRKGLQDHSVSLKGNCLPDGKKSQKTRKAKPAAIQRLTYRCKPRLKGYFFYYYFCQHSLFASREGVT